LSQTRNPPQAIIAAIVSGRSSRNWSALELASFEVATRHAAGTPSHSANEPIAISTSRTLAARRSAARAASDRGGIVAALT
jgi:hypothetical protein